jgi:hypothetical protein
MMRDRNLWNGEPERTFPLFKLLNLFCYSDRKLTNTPFFFFFWYARELPKVACSPPCGNPHGHRSFLELPPNNSTKAVKKNCIFLIYSCSSFSSAFLCANHSSYRQKITYLDFPCPFILFPTCAILVRTPIYSWVLQHYTFLVSSLFLFYFSVSTSTSLSPCVAPKWSQIDPHPSFTLQ